jgi:ABC-type nitrate/sulfonate/bicarbonate transport system permease component
MACICYDEKVWATLRVTLLSFILGAIGAIVRAIAVWSDDVTFEFLNF